MAGTAVPGGFRRIMQSSDYVIIWDVELLTPGERNAGKILAYHRDTPEKGGSVCYQDGVVTVLAREEFERTPKGQPAANPKTTPEIWRAVKSLEIKSLRLFAATKTGISGGPSSLERLSASRHFGKTAGRKAH
ncbi:unnamed protein product [Gemmata massiliana]|uniref:Uncharacterized protein n=1 Tax=Gemmata massiliana TaxID=1210884 RepID=A0A6P2D1L3_9BACT|nr:hypothetical protein [Gemmata massiliana]VTR95218.1 unnamed protein product [Gemmata massiliana]